MKSCVVWGDMGADSAADQYPTVNVCNDCVAAIAGTEDCQIVTVEGGYDDSLGDECHFCSKSKEDEDDES